VRGKSGGGDGVRGKGNDSGWRKGERGREGKTGGGGDNELNGGGGEEWKE